jgi:hypothetical protein
MTGNAPIFIDMEQRSDEWRKLRLGRPSASQFHRVVSDKGNRTTRSATTYKWQLLAERIFQVSFAPKIDRVPAVRHGVKYEEPARAAFAKAVGREIRPGGLVMTRDQKLLASPDGWIGDNPVEIKCPQPPGQLENLLSQPRDYWPQLQGQLLISQADCLHFWSWHPCTPASYVEVSRDTAFINTLNHELRLFCDELDRDEAALRAMGEYDVELFNELIEASKRKEEDDE